MPDYLNTYNSHRTESLHTDSYPDQEEPHHDLDLHLATPSSPSNERPGKPSLRQSAKKIGKWKARGRPNLEDPRGHCYLLGLPQDVLHILLGRLPPKTLVVLSATCKILREELEHEAIWRDSYVNRFLWVGAARDPQSKAEVKLLVQGCRGGGRGWKREGLDREAMLERWTASKATMVNHHPSIGCIDALSLSYPSYESQRPKGLVVGKTHPTPGKNEASSTPASPAEINPLNDLEINRSPAKMTHRQKYEALLAQTTRPPPYVLSTGIASGGIVKSDPIGGKVSKGYWGPGSNANYHLRPQLDLNIPPSAIFLPSRTQTFALWGLETGGCVHTTMLSRLHATHGGRASSVNVLSEVSDAHHGRVCDIWMPRWQSDTAQWVTGGEDGRIKLWRRYPGQTTSKSGQKALYDEVISGSMACLWTSPVTHTPLKGRSDGVQRRQNGKPDGMIFARFDAEHQVVCGVSEHGDLHVWFGVQSGALPSEVRIDVGSAEEHGAVVRMELEVSLGGSGLVASVLIHHLRSPTLSCHDISLKEGEITTSRRQYAAMSGVTSVVTCLEPVEPISTRPNPMSALSSPLSALTAPPDPTGEPLSRPPGFGRYILAGDGDGHVYIWPWDGPVAGDGFVSPIRVWSALKGKVTSLEANCGLIAAGSHNGHIDVFDPLPSPPVLLRTFHASSFSQLSPPERETAASDDVQAKHYTCNQIILENDLIVASIGHKVFAWRAGSGKGRQAGKTGEKKRASGGKGDTKGSVKGLDMKKINKDAAESHDAIREQAAGRVPSRQEAQHLAAMEDLGLKDGDEALQYALMLSMERAGSPDGEITPEVRVATGEGQDPDVLDALRAVEAFQEKEERQTRQILNMIRRAEEARGSSVDH